MLAESSTSPVKLAPTSSKLLGLIKYMLEAQSPLEGNRSVPEIDAFLVQLQKVIRKQYAKNEYHFIFYFLIRLECQCKKTLI